MNFSPIVRERSRVLIRPLVESHLFSLKWTDWIGQPVVPPTNTLNRIKKKTCWAQMKLSKQPQQSSERRIKQCVTTEAVPTTQ